MIAPRVSLQVDDCGIAWVRMGDREGRNTLGVAFVEELTAALARVSADPQARVCVVEGLAEVWCGGGARDVLEEIVARRRSPYDLTLTRSLLEVSVPTIAAMAGAAVGGGFVLGMACDVVILAEESRYGCNFMDLGLTPGMGATRLLQLAVGAPLAAEMLFGCEYFKGRHFRCRSLVNYVEPRDAVVDRARRVAERMADKPRHALELLKRSLVAPKRRAFEEARELEAVMHAVCVAHPDTQATLRENYGVPEAG